LTPTVVTFAVVIAGVFLTTSITAPPTAPQTEPQRSPASLIEASRLVTTPQPSMRELASASNAPSPKSPSFVELVKRIFVLSDRTATLARDDEIDAARELDNEAKLLLERIMRAHSDAGERALAMVIELPAAVPGEAPQPGFHTKLGVLQVILAAELARRQDAADKRGDRDRVASLTLALLDSMPINRHTAEMGDRVLYRSPYLQAAHEPMVLHLVELAGEDAVSPEIATRLLSTLWDNLKASGARSSAKLARLALVMLDDPNPSQIIVACRQLLSDPRYRDLALGWLLERDDAELTRSVAKLAGSELPPKAAIAVLRALSPMLQHTRGTFLAIGARAPEVVADAYREQLAAGTHPELRRELVMGIGMLPNARGLTIARLALSQDPSVEVRIQALFVHTFHNDAAGAEAAIHQVLNDPRVASNPMHLAAIILALQNLEHEDANVIARVGARLQRMAITPRSRARLNELLARSIPNEGR